jgi:hypothetical protein
MTNSHRVERLSCNCQSNDEAADVCFKSTHREIAGLTKKYVASTTLVPTTRSTEHSVREGSVLMLFLGMINPLASGRFLLRK